MAISVGLPKTGDSAKDYQLTLELPMENFTEMPNPFLTEEWYPQSGVQLTWPHEDTDWAYMLPEVQECFVQIAGEISKREIVFIVAPDVENVKSQLAGRVQMENVRFYQCNTNDTWARDHGAITLINAQKPQLLDFCFNGWGMKFASNYDNQITRKVYSDGCLEGEYSNCLDFVLEGGSIESDGRGTLLTTSECLLSANRNDTLNKQDIETYLKSKFYLQQVLWLDYGYLAGDDTDSHIDTLARMCPEDTIVYVKCMDEKDEHFEDLRKMEEQLKSFRTLEGNPYRLLPLPMADAIIEDGERLPATYANFLVINNAVLYPTYNQPENDKEAAQVLSVAFPGRDIVGIDCRSLIRQHGSLHCVTMQFPRGVLK